MMPVAVSQATITRRSVVYNPSVANGKLSNGHYHNIGPEPFVFTTIGRVFDVSSSMFAEELAVVDRAQGIRKTYAEFKEDVDKLARGFLALNFQQGDRIGIWSPNRYEWFVTQMASAKAGLLLVAINAAYQAPEFEFCLTKTSLKGVIIPEKFYVQEYYKMICNLVPEVLESKPGSIKSKKHPYFETLIVMTQETLPGAFKFSDVLNAGGSKEIQSLNDLQSKINPDEAALILFTSGTTSKPKASVLNHFTLVNSCASTCRQLGYFVEKHILCCHLPMFHIFGCGGSSLASVISGLTLVFPSHEYNVSKSLAAIEEEKCTAVYGTPAMLKDMVQLPDFKLRNTSSIQIVLGGGDRVEPELIKQLYKSFPDAGIFTIYGATETSGQGSLGKCDRSWTNEQMDHQGKVAYHLEVKIVNSENRVVPYGCDGEICSRSIMGMTGYWEDEDKTREVIKDGWYHTGDVGSLTADGYLTISGRIKDLIIRGGENVSPKEVESVLSTHPDVTFAQVFGVNDDRLTEVVCAWIILKENSTLTEQEVREFCKGKMAHFKIPKYVRFVDKYPMTPTRKVQKFVMKNEMNELLAKGLI